MILHKVKVYPSKIALPKKKQLAWKIAEIASDNAKLNNDAIEMSINRIIDNASVAIASLNRNPVISAREMAKAHLRNGGSTLFGIDSKIKFKKPEIILGYLYNKNVPFHSWHNFVWINRVKPDNLHIHFSLLNSWVVSWARKKNLKINSYTINSKKSALSL